ncbi:MAG TPA: hypothetical protein VGH43_03220 [Jatrophihabitans sp.]|jgi:hypothetical protein
MTEHEPNRARAGLVVRAVTRMLPAGPIRDRYRQAFLAELHGLGGISSMLFLFGLLSRSFALRAAVRNPSADSSTISAPAKPLLCRTGLHHRWRTYLNPDGEPYRHCVRCGADRYDGMGQTNVAGNVAGNMVMPGW